MAEPIVATQPRPLATLAQFSVFESLYLARLTEQWLNCKLRISVTTEQNKYVKLLWECILNINRLLTHLVLNCKGAEVQLTCKQ